MKKSSFFTTAARRLRKDMTPAEAKLWDILRGSQLTGWKFRRQQPIPPYIADFCSFGDRVIVELDGDSHLGREEHDAKRQDALIKFGFEVIRFENFEVMLNENSVIERIVALRRKREHSQDPSPLAPLPQGERGTGMKEDFA